MTVTRLRSGCSTTAARPVRATSTQAFIAQARIEAEFAARQIDGRPAAQTADESLKLSRSPETFGRARFVDGDQQPGCDRKRSDQTGDRYPGLGVPHASDSWLAAFRT